MATDILNREAYDELLRVLSLEEDLEYIEKTARPILKRKKEELLKILDNGGVEK